LLGASDSTAPAASLVAPLPPPTTSVVAEAADSEAAAEEAAEDAATADEEAAAIEAFWAEERQEASLLGRTVSGALQDSAPFESMAMKVKFVPAG